MRRVIPMTEHYQHYLEEMKESFWGDLYGRTKELWKGFWEGNHGGSGTATWEPRSTSG